MVPAWSFLLALASALIILLAVLSIHNWTFPLLSPVGVKDDAASMFFGAWSGEIEHCLMEARQA